MPKMARCPGPRRDGPAAGSTRDATRSIRLAYRWVVLDNTGGRRRRALWVGIVGVGLAGFIVVTIVDDDDDPPSQVDDGSLERFCSALAADYEAVVDSIAEPESIGQDGEIVLTTARRIYSRLGDDAPEEYEDVATELAGGIDRAIDGTLTAKERQGLIGEHDRLARDTASRCGADAPR